ncbi:Hypothetical protein R9X50_00294000 [Acrodontium crateriforme]|uniref:Major facilitator superfamily (MFS) profile domain-containing protein n=1 Tax=Acrodontium crateriforme TaxID=150365 RepID=A0AAQ3M1S6_9PEZI|nr:Hypothetical protein R9X50_00294000 [Acrodontium crateriforme]
MPFAKDYARDHTDGENGPTESSPLIPGPSTVDASIEAHDNGRIAKDSLQASSEPLDEPKSLQLSKGRTAVCTIALAFLILLQATNISMLTTIQSRIAAELDAFENTSWFTSAYLIAMAALSPLNGKLSSVFSPRICVFVSTLILAVGAIVTSAANTFEVFITGRAITGVGASGIYIVSMILALEITGPKGRGLAIGLLNSGYTIGVAIGATLAGALLPLTGWRALFYLQAPVSVVSGIALLIAIPRNLNSSQKEDDSNVTTLQKLSTLDYFGALSLTGSILLVLYALSSATTIPLLPVFLSALAFLVFVLNELYIAVDPLIPIALLNSRGLVLSCIGTTGYMMARWSVLFYMPTYALAVRQWSPATAGSFLIPTNAGFALGGIIVGWLHIKRTGSFYLSTLIVYALFSLTLVALAFLTTRHSAVAVVILDITICGAVTGAALNYVLAHLLHLTPRDTHYVTTSLLSTFRGFAGSFGSAVYGGIFTRTLHQSLTTRFADAGLRHRQDLVRRLLGSPNLVKELKDVEKKIAVAGYEDALRVLYLSAAALAALMLLLQAGTGCKGAKLEAALDETIDGGERDRNRDGAETT